jgi:hypothetical protein
MRQERKDVTNYDKGSRKPTRTAIAVEAVMLGAMAAVLAWLIGDGDRGFWNCAGIVAYTVMTTWSLVSVVRLVRRRWTWTEPVPAGDDRVWCPSLPSITGYVDRDGDRWMVREDGRLVLRPAGPAITKEDAETDYGPLRPSTWWNDRPSSRDIGPL